MSIIGITSNGTDISNIVVDLYMAAAFTQINHRLLLKMKDISVN